MVTTLTVATWLGPTTTGESLTTSAAPFGLITVTVKRCVSPRWFVNRIRCWFATCPAGSSRYVSRPPRTTSTSASQRVSIRRPIVPKATVISAR